MYKVTIEKEIGKDGDYKRFEDVYEQTVENLDIEAVIAVVNSLKKAE